MHGLKRKARTAYSHYNILYNYTKYIQNNKNFNLFYAFEAQF